MDLQLIDNMLWIGGSAYGAVIGGAIILFINTKALTMDYVRSDTCQIET